jgi:hypothetical protein
MDGIELQWLFAHIAPEVERDRIARHRQALPETIRPQRERFQQPAPARHAPQRIAANRQAAVALDAGRQAFAVTRPERFQLDRIGREDGHVIALCRAIAAEPREVRFRAAKGRRETLNEMSNAHRIILDAQGSRASITIIHILDQRFGARQGKNCVVQWPRYPIAGDLCAHNSCLWTAARPSRSPRK